MSIGNAVNVYVTTDTKPDPAESWEILLISTDGAKPFKFYRNLGDVKKDYPPVVETVTDPETGDTYEVERYSRTYGQAKAIFEQTPSTADNLVSRIQIVGIDKPSSPAELLEKIEGIQEEYNDWQVFMTDIESVEYIQACSAWADSTLLEFSQINAGIEEHPKQYFARFYISEENKEDFLQSLENGAVIFQNERASIHAVTNENEELAAAIYSNLAAHYPNHSTAKFKQLNGITPIDLKRTEKDTLEAYNINFYKQEYKKIFFREGVCTNGQYIDINIARDYIVKRIRDRIYELFLRHKVIPYTNGGFSQIGDAVIGGIRDAFDRDMVASNLDGQPDMEIMIPTVSDSSREQAMNREMPPIYFLARAAGAIHKAPVKGVLSMDFERNLINYINLGFI